MSDPDDTAEGRRAWSAHDEDEVVRVQKAFAAAIHELMEDGTYLHHQYIIMAAADLIGTMIATDMLLDKKEPGEILTFEQHMEAITKAVRSGMNLTFTSATRGN